MSTFAEFALAHLPAPPARVLEVGCGRDGGAAYELAAAGYEVLAVDPHAPEGPLFRQVTLEELDDPGPFDAVVAGRVLHHVDPLGPALAKLAALAPLLLLDEFAWEELDESTRDWYESQYRMLVASGQQPPGPPDLARWREEHQDLHPSDVLLRELASRYDEQLREPRPYLYHWLGGVATEALEDGLIAAGAIRPLGLRYAGVSRTATVRSPAAPR
jgi:SAM-dependent methyltransferase